MFGYMYLYVRVNVVSRCVCALARLGPIGSLHKKNNITSYEQVRT